MSRAAPELTNSITRAGAGAGKTTGLVNRVIEVYQDFRVRGETPRIVLTTFTRKATQEIKERLIARACRDLNPELLQFVSDPSRLQVVTIHGLLNTFLRQLGHLAGLDAGFGIVSESEGFGLARLALREVIVTGEIDPRWLETYGFDRVLSMCRAYDLARREHGPLEPADLSDLETAARREAEVWSDRLTRLCDEILAGCPDESLRKFARQLAEFAENWDGSCGTIAVPRKPNASKKKPELDDWHRRISTEVSEFKDEMKRPCWDSSPWGEVTAEWPHFKELAESFHEKLSALKDARAQFEMNDLELRTLEILRAKPFLGAVFAENWDYWLIDEYQDTSPAQVACLDALIGDRPRYLVGDPQQSIYLFRGAEVRVFDAAERQIAATGGKLYRMRRNWRSTPDLLAFINAFIGDVGGRHFEAMEPRPETGGTPGICASLVRVETADAELAAVVVKIGRLVAGGASLEQICILGRTHSKLMDVSRVLKDHGYPTHVHSSRGFETRREVTDARAVWKFLVNPHDNLNLMILLRSPWFFCPDATLSEWMKDQPRSLWRELERLPDAPDAIARLRAARARVDAAGLTRAFEDTLVDSGMLDLSLVNDPAGRKESNLWKLIARARELEKEGGGSALDFVRASTSDNALDAAEGDAASAQEPNCINLMTIHGAKGLQFDHVILPGIGESPRRGVVPDFSVTDGKFHFPGWSETEQKTIPTPLDHVGHRARGRREIEEYDRWLYVALTRAKHSLTLTWSAAKPDSWAGRSAFCALPDGMHDRHNFSFEIGTGGGEPSRFSGTAGPPTSVREPFGPITPAAEERSAVTEVIAQSNSVPEPEAAIVLVDRWRSQTVGTRIHRALEALKFGIEPESTEFAGPLEFVLGITDPPMRELIRSGNPEWGFQVKLKRRTIEGQIDLWGKHEGVLYVVDYKSGSKRFGEDAFRQLGVYAWALRRFGHDEPARLVVIYPVTGAVEIRDFTAASFDRWETEFGGT